MPESRAFTIASAGVIVLALATATPLPVAAGWPLDPSVNLPVCTASGSQGVTRIAPDGCGGAIIAWTDLRSGTDGDVYAQRISATGETQWSADGVALGMGTGSRRVSALTPDGAGGAFVTWGDMLSGQCAAYVQRVTADGSVPWTPNGLALNPSSDYNWSLPTIISDGAGGAIVAWQDGRRPFPDGHDIYAQRVTAAGTILWAPDGVGVCTATAHQGSPTISTDGAGGAIVAWMDERGGDYHAYARRISASGTALWTDGGVPLCTAQGYQGYPAITSDGAGGAIVAWTDRRDEQGGVYVQRISSEGEILWTPAGVRPCVTAGDRFMPAIVSDGAGGAIVTWTEYRVGSYKDVYAQRISADGSAQWGDEGVAICTAASSQEYPTPCSDGAGGAIITWEDARDGGGDVYAQRVSAAGVVQWKADGVAISTAYGHQYVPVLTADGAGGAIVAWADDHAEGDIHAQRVYAGGRLYADALVAAPGESAPGLALEPIHPNPSAGGTITVRFALASGTPATLELHDVAGRRVARRQVDSLGPGLHSLDLRTDAGLAPGLYLVTLRQGPLTRMV